MRYMSLHAIEALTPMHTFPTHEHDLLRFPARHVVELARRASASRKTSTPFRVSIRPKYTS